MAKDPLAHALAQIEFHRGKVSKWEQYVALHRELYGDDDARADPLPNPPARLRPSPNTGAIAATRVGARHILEREGGYVQTADLIAKLAQMGIEVGGAEPSSTLSARLSGDPEIESRRGQGYRLKKSGEMEGAAASRESEVAAAPLFAPDSADDDGREVVHDNMNH